MSTEYKAATEEEIKNADAKEILEGQEVDDNADVEGQAYYITCGCGTRYRFPCRPSWYRCYRGCGKTFYLCR